MMAHHKKKGRASSHSSATNLPRKERPTPCVNQTTENPPQSSLSIHIGPMVFFSMMTTPFLASPKSSLLLWSVVAHQRAFARAQWP